jgi:hypothetical protein
MMSTIWASSAPPTYGTATLSFPFGVTASFTAHARTAAAARAYFSACRSDGSPHRHMWCDGNKPQLLAEDQTYRGPAPPQGWSNSTSCKGPCHKMQDSDQEQTRRTDTHHCPEPSTHVSAVSGERTR